MERIPFDIGYRKDIESGECKVVTRDGDPVRILCWDRKMKDMEILGIVTINGEEDIVEVQSPTGRVYPKGRDHSFDLFIVKNKLRMVGFLPTWKKADIDDKGWRFYANRCLYHDGYTLSLDDLLKLPKED